MSKDLIPFFIKELSSFYSDTEAINFAYWCINYMFEKSRSEWKIIEDFELKTNEKAQIENIILKLKDYQPIQYIFGQTDFYGLKIKVNSSCLIPRPETEELVHWILQSEYNNALDIGTGSGCVAVALAKHSNAQISALDKSLEALNIAKENAAMHQVNITFLHHDIFEEIQFNSPFDLIVSNPPYVLNNEKPYMKKNVLDYEPHLALFVEDDQPLKFYQQIIHFSKHNLKAQGNIFFEINEQYADQIKNLLEKNSFENILIKKDLQSKNRMVKANKKL